MGTRFLGFVRVCACPQNYFFHKFSSMVVQAGIHSQRCVQGYICGAPRSTRTCALARALSCRVVCLLR